MKKYFTLACLLILFAFLVKPARGITHVFTRHPSNPLSVNLSSQYLNTFQSDVFYDHHNNLRVLFAAQDTSHRYKIVVGSSENGLDWKIDKVVVTNPSINLFGPRQLKTESGFEIYYGSEEETIKIYRVRCDHNFSCDTTGTKVIDTKQGTWNESTAASPFPIRENNKTFIFYEGLRDGIWHMGMSYSDDGNTWIQCPESFFTTAGGAFLTKKQSSYYLYFHNSQANGIEVVESDNALGCSMQWKERHYILQKKEPYEINHIVAPSLVEVDQKLHLYYTGRDTANNWVFNLATEPLAVSPSPTVPSFTPTITPPFIPTSTLTPTPTPTIHVTLAPLVFTPTPSPTSFITQQIVIIPGMLASWNKEALLHNKPASQSEWKTPSFVKEYEGLIKTLENHGYKKDKNLFIFSYDWRQRLNKTTKQFELYLQEKVYKDNPNAKVSIIGHSLGGLVGRLYAQENPHKIQKLVTVGSPHAGVVQMYSLLEAGEIDRDNSSLWLGAKILLSLHKTPSTSDKEIMQNILPIAYDLFPTFNFLKLNGVFLSLEKLGIQNTTLQTYNRTIASINAFVVSAFGEKFKNNTPAGYIIETASTLDKLLDRYKDGRPKNSLYENGDFTVISRSGSLINTQQLKLEADHGEIVSEKDSVIKILNILNIQLDPNKVVSGEKTVISPALIFLMQSPARMEVSMPNKKVYLEEEGIIYIPSPQSGDYKIRARGLAKGGYSITTIYIGEKGETHHTINGFISQNPPETQVDEYTLNLKSENITQPLIFNEEDLLKNFVFSLNKLDPQNVFLIECIQYLKQLEKTVLLKDKKSILLKAQQELFKAFRFTTKKTEIYTLFDTFETLYMSFLKKYNESNVLQIEKKFQEAQNLFINKVNRVSLIKARQLNVKHQLIILEKVEKKLTLYRELIKEKNFTQAEIVINSITELLLSI